MRQFHYPTEQYGTARRLLRWVRRSLSGLLCSRNARPQKALVGRAQLRLCQPPRRRQVANEGRAMGDRAGHPRLRRNKQAWRDHRYVWELTRAVGGLIQATYYEVEKSTFDFVELRS